MKQQPLIVGCDPSSKKLCFYALSPTTPTAKARVYMIGGKAKYSPQVAAEALTACTEAIADFASMARDGGEKFLFLEEPVMGRGGVRATMVQSFPSGVIQACFVQAGYTVYLINNSKWKSWLGVAGSRTKAGEAKKSTVRAMKGRFPKDAQIVGDDGDLLDAAALARFGYETIDRGRRMANPRGMSDT